MVMADRPARRTHADLTGHAHPRWTSPDPLDPSLREPTRLSTMAGEVSTMCWRPAPDPPAASHRGRRPRHLPTPITGMPTMTDFTTASAPVPDARAASSFESASPFELVTRTRLDD